MLYVIGIGFRPLDKKAREIVLNSETILASDRLYEVFKGYEEFEKVKDKIKVIDNVDETMNFITSKLPPYHSSCIRGPDVLWHWQEGCQRIWKGCS